MSRAAIKRHSGALIALALAAVLVLLALVTTGFGLDESITVSPGTTWAEIGLTLVGAGACATGLAIGSPGRVWGGATVALFLALVAFTALSILWSVQPDNSWQAADLTLAYLLTFAGAAALARVLPERWPSLVGGVAIAMSVLCAYGLVTKVFPSALDTFGRLQAPLGYWNATGLAAALGMAPCLWAWNRDALPPAVRGLAVPALASLISVVVLSYSRSALLAALIALACWFAVTPRRLNGALLLACSGLGAAVVTGWALSKSGLTGDNIAFATRRSAGHTFGLVLLVSGLALSALGVAVARAGERVTVPAAVSRRIGAALIVGLALLPFVAVVGLAESSRGLTGEISHAWSSLTSVQETTGSSASRIFALGSSRPLYWSEGITVGEHALLKGVGAFGYATARTRYTTNPAVVVHAHSYVVQTFADLGLLGLAISLALLVAWCIAAARAAAPSRRWSALTPSLAAEREGIVALVIVALAFGAQSAIDWTWYFPGVAVPALLCAGWLAGRGPLEQAVGRTRDRASLIARPAIGAAVIAIATGALLCGWLIWQPLRSAQSVSSAYAAIANGQLPSAFTDARDAAAADPLALQPKLLLSALYQSVHDLGRARAELVSATELQPDNPASWMSLGTYDLQQQRPALALASLRRAQALDPSNATVGALVTQASTELGQK